MSPSNHSTLYAGAAQVKTTPVLGTRINGDFVTHYATQIHDDLFSKALVFKQGATHLAFVMVDICIMPKDFVDSVKAEITKATGILGSNILIASTHTHAAGAVAEVHLGAADLAYTKRLPGLIVASVQQALQRLAPAQVAFGHIVAPEHLRCRRYEMVPDYQPLNPVTGGLDAVKTNPFGDEDSIRKSIAPTDPGLGYLAVKGLDGSWISLLANYSLHYVGDWPNGTISADYFGVFSKEMAHLLQADADFVGMMSNGTSGDVNIWDFQDNTGYPLGHFEKSDFIGKDLAKRVSESIPDLAWQTNACLEALLEVPAIPIIKPDSQAVAAAKELLIGTDFRSIQPTAAGLRKIYAREQILLNELAPTRDCPVQAFRIGDGIIGALAGEFFSETGLYLKNQAPVNSYFTITMANGNVGYVPPAREKMLGGYETWLCRYSCLEPDAEATIRTTLKGLIDNLSLG
ncbi:hypothetical protein CLV98_10426 [Dyadobacter jejuensis]|uniref:Neutral/alkaline ceramidase-like enzyme n=1 Tax=Dyadobacter jejuensis TaxID=1082580 RepID=A0A316ALP3_9BACT|nr:hypothetical protein [Dyadobacter jejuensis]PWJ58169.1 hypothetical protein CLV98_10426 [Dyadobacter jejuensis]